MTFSRLDTFLPPIPYSSSKNPAQFGIDHGSAKSSPAKHHQPTVPLPTPTESKLPVELISVDSSLEYLDVVLLVGSSL